MNKLLTCSAVIALAVTIAPAIAQPAPPPPPGVASGTAPPLAPPTAPRVHMVIMSYKVVTRDEVARHVRDLFGRLDTNHDGFITKEEVEATHQKMAGMMGTHDDFEKRFAAHRLPPPDRAAMFDELDANHDGSISRQEFVAGQPRLQERRVLIMREGGDAGTSGAPGGPGTKMRMHGMGIAGLSGHLFEMADTNHDNRVSLAEAQAAALAHFDRADVNHDGKITPEERQQMRELMRGQHRPS
jgi:hypothetical protein